MEQKPEPIAKTACGGILTDPETENYPSADYKGERFYFCARACLRAFEKNPNGFMNGEVEHPLGDD